MQQKDFQMAILKAVSGFVVYAADGNLDIDATVNSIKSAVLSELENTAVRDQEIEVALDAVYDQLGSDTCPTPTAVNMTAISLIGNDFAKMAGVTEEVKGFLSRTSRFVSQRGRNGGLKRVSK